MLISEFVMYNTKNIEMMMALRSLHHPNILTFLGIITDSPGRVVILTNFVTGKNLYSAAA